jgi:hypothetical protein
MAVNVRVIRNVRAEHRTERRGPGRLLTVLLLSSSLASVSTPAHGAADGQFWLKCAASNRLSDDPIIYPGDPGASHLHEFLGNESTNAHSTYADMVTAETNCRLTADTAAYWVPALIGPDGPVRVVGVAVYYRGPVGRTVAPPPDHRAVAGPSGINKSWRSCVGVVGTKSDTIPDCGDARVKANILFPECTDGRTDSADHRAHLAYVVKGRCPGTHPVRITRVALHVTFDSTGGSGFILSSDDGTPGASLHADFWNTWDQETLESLVARCINLDVVCKNLRG